MARERRYLWTWAVVLALSAGARAADSAKTSDEAPAAGIEGLIKQLDQQDPAIRAKAASALLKRGAAVLPALEAEAERARRAANEGKDQIEQLAALIRAGEAAGGWQVSLGTPRATVPEGAHVPLRITVTNRSTEKNVYAPPQQAEFMALADYEHRAKGYLYVYAARLGVQGQELASPVGRRERVFFNSLEKLFPAGAAPAVSLVLEPADETAQKELEAAIEDLPLRLKARLAPGDYRVQVLLRPNAKAPLLASNAVTFTVAPVDWKALDQAEAAREEKQIAAAEAALEKDPALREKLRGAAAKLDDEDWQAREDASKALAQAGVNALPELERARTSGASLEARTRAGQLLEALRTQLVEGGEPEAGLRATLHLDRKEVRVGGALKLSLEVKNVAQEARPFVCVRAFELASPYLASEMTSARAQIEIRREDGALGSQGQGIIADMEQERDGDTVELKPGMVKTRAAVLTVSDEGLMRAIELAADDAPFEQDVHLPPGRYRVRVVYYALTKGLVKNAADDLRSNWVTLDVRE